jgi:hypothetical protein
MRSPFRLSGIRRSRYREPCVHVLVQIKSPNPECRWSTSQHSRFFRGFPYREIGTSDVAVHMYHEFPNPELRCHLSSTRTWGPTLPRPLRDFADRGSTTTGPLPLETPNARIPMLRIRATCLHSDRRTRLNRRIALRGFDVHGILALTNPNFPVCDGQGLFRCLSVDRLVTPPGSNDPWDFASLLDDSNRRFSSSMKRSPLHHLRLVRPSSWVCSLDPTTELSLQDFLTRIPSKEYLWSPPS